MTWPMHDAGPTTPESRQQRSRQQARQARGHTGHDGRDGRDGRGRPRPSGPAPMPPPEGFMPGGVPTPAETTMPLTLNWGAAADTAAPPGTRRPVRPDGAQPADFVRPRFTPFPEEYQPRTRRPPEPGRPGAPPGRRVRRAAEPGTGPATQARRSLISSSTGMAVGTLVSRVTGFLRTAVFLYALGLTDTANAYNNSNTLPNTIYYLMLGGIFTSVVVPLLVKAIKHDPDGGEAYAQRIFTLGVLALLAVTVVGTALSNPLVSLYAPGGTAAAHNLTVVWAYFFIPQIFFYGMSSLIGAVLNTRGSFAAPMWMPVINNVVVIVVGGLYVTTAGLGRTSATISTGAVQLLGFGTTLGVVLQTVALLPALRKVGFRWRPDFAFRGVEVREIRRMTGWMTGYVVTQWASNLVAQRIANTAASRGDQAHGYSAYTYAWMLFQLPYAIIGISVITALLPRMSEHADVRRYSLVRNDFSTGVRLSSAIVVPAAIFLGVLGGPVAQVIASYGSSDAAKAQYIGLVFSLFSLGLVPYMLTQLQLRVFYSFHDSRTAAMVGLLTMAVGIVGDVVALESLPARDVVAGLAVAFGVANLVGAIAGWILLLRRVGSLDGWAVARSLLRMHLATVPGVIFALLVMYGAGRVVHHPSSAYGILVTLVGGGGAVLLYAVCARKLRVAEFGFLLRTVAGRFGGQSGRH
jgi:murein biosynthesis integral membrane protein MurJ